VGLGIVEVRDSVETRGFGGTPGDDRVGHADDGGRVHAPAEFGESGSVGAKSAPHGFGEYGAEVLFIFAFTVITDSLVRVKIPVCAHGMLSRSYEHQRRGRDGTNARVGRQVSGGEVGEPAGDVLFAKCEALAAEKNECIEDRAPGHLVFVERIVKMARADWIFGKNE